MTPPTPRPSPPLLPRSMLSSARSTTMTSTWLPVPPPPLIATIINPRCPLCFPMFFAGVSIAARSNFKIGSLDEVVVFSCNMAQWCHWIIEGSYFDFRVNWERYMWALANWQYLKL